MITALICFAIIAQANTKHYLVETKDGQNRNHYMIETSDVKNKSVVGSDYANEVGGIDYANEIGGTDYANEGCSRGQMVFSGLSQTAKDTILDLHNEARSRVALGNQRGQPSAANMMKLTWSTELENIAQKYADTCPGPNHNEARTPGDVYFGENIAWNMYMKLDKPEDVENTQGGLKWYIDNWFSEVDDFNGNNLVAYSTNGPVVGHYVQMVWGETSEVGCGSVATAKDKSGMFSNWLYCNYSPGGNILGTVLYEKGPACSKCPTGTKCEGNLGLCVWSQNRGRDIHSGQHRESHSNEQQGVDILNEYGTSFEFYEFYEDKGKDYEHEERNNQSDEQAGGDIHTDEQRGKDHHLDEQSRSAIHSDEHQGSAIHSDEHQGSAIHSEEHQGRTIHSDEHQGRAIHSDEHQGSAIHPYEHQGSTVHSDEHQGSAIHSDEHQGRAIQSDEHQGSTIHSDEHQRSAIHLDEHQGRAIHSDEHQGSTIHSDEHDGIHPNLRYLRFNPHREETGTKSQEQQKEKGKVQHGREAKTENQEGDKLKEGQQHDKQGGEEMNHRKM